MTTIAWDGRILAADGMMSEGDRISELHAQKIFRADDFMVGGEWNILGEHVMAFAYAGTYGADQAIISALGESLNHETTLPANYSVSAILVTQGGQCWVLNTREGSETIQLYRVGQPMKCGYALGTGGDYAMGAMKTGADAYQAVKIACTLDAYSGGSIQIWKPEVVGTTKHGQEFKPDERKSIWIGE